MFIPSALWPMLKHCRPDILARGHMSLLHRSPVSFATQNGVKHHVWWQKLSSHWLVMRMNQWSHLTHGRWEELPQLSIFQHIRDDKIIEELLTGSCSMAKSVHSDCRLNFPVSNNYMVLYNFMPKLNSLSYIVIDAPTLLKTVDAF